MTLIISESVLSEAINRGKIESAIRDKEVCEIKYREKNGLKKRTIYPVLLGYTIAGNKAIRAFQPEGFTNTRIPRWKIFLWDKIVGFKKTGKKFEVPELYNYQGDKMFSKILVKI
jgi:hypothetical protein